MSKLTQMFPPIHNIALFLDFDGTLAPIQDDASTVRLDDGMDEVLKKLKNALGLGPVIISGRDLDDLSARIPQFLHRIGNHGLRSALPGSATAPKPPPIPHKLVEMLEEVIYAHPGTFAEYKASVVAVHYRAAPNNRVSLQRSLSNLPLDGFQYSLEAGKMIFELKPFNASKGLALREVMADYPELKPIMFGDDTTDEAAMRAAQDLGGLGVKVGKGTSCANMRLENVAAVNLMLTKWAN